jgi:colanic acid/amylovoran biosynthesis glycosyltransferase
MRYVKKYLFLVVLFIYIFTAHAQNKHLKILYLIDSYPKLTETFIFESISGMLDLGHDVWIYARQKTKEDVKHPAIAKYNLDSRVFIKDVPQNMNEFDVIICQFGDLSFRIPEDFLNHNIPYITCIRGSDITQGIHKKIKRYKLLFARSDLFLPVCNYFKTKIESLGCPAEKVKVHNSSIDCDAFPYSMRSVKKWQTIELISVGRLVEKKGRKRLLQALAIIRRVYPHVHLTLIGNGDQRDFLEQYVCRLGLSKNVTFIYQASQAEVRDALSKAHIFILTSETASDGNEEGIPNALKEAMAAGVPVVATDHAGNSELIKHKKNGILIPEKDPHATAHAVFYLLSHQHAWKAMTQKARKTSELFDRKRLAEELETILYNVIAEKKA